MKYVLIKLGKIEICLAEIVDFKALGNNHILSNGLKIGMINNDRLGKIDFHGVFSSPAAEAMVRKAYKTKEVNIWKLKDAESSIEAFQQYRLTNLRFRQSMPLGNIHEYRFSLEK